MMSYLEKLIEIKPGDTKIEAVKSSNYDLTEVNDLFYKEIRTSRGWISWFMGLFFMSMPLIFYIHSIGNTDHKSDYTFSYILIGIGLICIINGFIAPIKFLVFDRINGIIKLPRIFRSTVEVKFSEGEGSIVYINSSPGVISGMLNFTISKDGVNIGGRITQVGVEDYWNFLVWYMDKNRPLPPGTAFDPYRNNDFIRRKSEGFPKPLYPSNIPTPEVTSEQQAERERIGGW